METNSDTPLAEWEAVEGMAIEGRGQEDGGGEVYSAMHLCTGRGRLRLGWEPVPLRATPPSARTLRCCPTRLQTVLQEIAVQNRRGPYKDLWELKNGYKLT